MNSICEPFALRGSEFRRLCRRHTTSRRPLPRLSLPQHCEC
jgi:hypothetical protein